MDIAILKSYWPLLLVAAFFGFRHYKQSKIKKLLPELKNEGAQIVDVRSREEFQAGHNPASINIPLNDLANNLNQLNIKLPVIVCCASGGRSAMAERLLKSKGFNVHNAGCWQNTL